MAHVIFRPGKMVSKHIDSYLKNVVSHVDLDNGNVVQLVGLVSGQTDLYTASTPATVTTQEVFIIDSPVRNLIGGLYAIDVVDPREFYTPAGKIARARKVIPGDTMFISAIGISGSPVVGQYAIPAADSVVLAAAANTSGNSIVQFKIIANESFFVGTETVAGYRLECFANSKS
jgi:hypothetical protein